MKRWKRLLGVCLGCFLGLWLVINQASAQEGGKWFDMSDFDPIGKLMDPIQEAIPNLYIKGLIWNQTRMPLKGKSGRDSEDLAWGRPGRNRHWDFDSIEFLGELELRWTPTYNLEFVNIWHQLYDGIYDWDHYWRNDKENQTKYVEREMEFYRDYHRYLREAYVRWFATPRLTITAGKQQQNWGKIDFQLIDIINPNDRRMGGRYIISDAEYRRIPTWILTSRYSLGKGAWIEATWNLDFEPEPDLVSGMSTIGWAYDTQNNPQHPSPGIPVLRKLRADKPSGAFQNHEWFFRGGFRWKGYDAWLFYGYHWSDLPVFFFKYFNPTGLPMVTIAPEHTRLHSIGLAFDKNFNFLGRPWLLIYESKYDLNVYLPEFRNPGELFSILQRQTGTHRDDAWRKMNILTQGLEFDTVWGPQEHYTFLFGAVYVNVFGWSGTVPVLNARRRSMWDFFYAVSIPIRKYHFEDRLKFVHGSEFLPVDGQGNSLLEVSYKFSNYLSATITYKYYWGNVNDGPYAKWRDRDVLDFRFKYEF